MRTRSSNCKHAAAIARHMEASEAKAVVHCSIDAVRTDNWPRGAMENASAYGARDCRFDSCWVMCVRRQSSRIHAAMNMGADIFTSTLACAAERIVSDCDELSMITGRDNGPPRT